MTEVVIGALILSRIDQHAGEKVMAWVWMGIAALAAALQVWVG